MFISVGNFINFECHVKGNYLPAAVRPAGGLGYPDTVRYIRKSEEGGRSQGSKFL